MNIKKTALIVGGFVGSGVLYSMAPNRDRSRKRRLKPFENTYIAHRGLFDNNTECPENSMKAFLNAIEHGYGIELDVRLTKDGLPVVFHDDDLYRVCGIRKKVSDMNYSELRSYYLFSSEEKIPLFKDVLSMIDGKVPLIIEIKAEYDVFDICNKVMRMLYCYPGYFCIESFSPFVLKWFKDHEPNVLRGQLSMDFFDESKGIIKPWPVKFTAKNLIGNIFSRPDFVSYEFIGANSIPMLIHRKLYEGKSAAWTIRSQEELEYAKKYFDIIIFDGFIPDEKRYLV